MCVCVCVCVCMYMYVCECMSICPYGMYICTHSVQPLFSWWRGTPVPVDGRVCYCV